jgi:hypothetical protein
MSIRMSLHILLARPTGCRRASGAGATNRAVVSHPKATR